MLTSESLNALALHFRALADLCESAALAKPAPAAAQGAAAPAPADEAPKAKRGRPAKADAAPAPAKDEPTDTAGTVTADHPKRAELRTVAGEYAALPNVGRAKAVEAMKLYGESSALVPDADLVDAIKHFRALAAKAKPAPAPADEPL